MPDKNYQAIIDALDVLARGASKKTNGKITGVNLAKEAGVSKATLYRYFKEFSALNNEYEALRRSGVRLVDDAPETVRDAYKLMEQEVKTLRSELSRVSKDSERINKLKSHQIQLLWMENEQLKAEIGRLQELALKAKNIAALPVRKKVADKTNDG